MSAVNFIKQNSNMKKHLLRCMSVNAHSKVITQNDNAKAMLWALPEFKLDTDFDKPHVGVISNWFESNPCNRKLDQYSETIKNSLDSMGIHGFRANTVGVSDGITMGTPSMRYSLPSRELISHSIELQAKGGNYDGLIVVPGCDKNMPAATMALFRLDIPGIIVYGGSMPPSYLPTDTKKENPLQIVSSFEAQGEYMAGKISLEEKNEIVRYTCSKSCGACAGLYTANTMSSVIEVLGFSLPNSATFPSLSKAKFNECELSAYAMEFLLTNDIKPSDILTKESFYNAIKLVNVLGGSTNAVIHLLAMAEAAQIDLTLDDFTQFKHIPVLSDMKPHGKYVMNDLHNVGGMTELMKYLISSDIINGDCKTVTGLTLKENYFMTPLKSNSQQYHIVSEDVLQRTDRCELTKKDFHKVIRPLEDPFKKTSHIRILRGNMAEQGCVSKLNSEDSFYEGKAIVFDTEKEMLTALKNGEITRDHIIVIRYQGESMGCPEMLAPTSALIGYFGEDAPPLLTDGRFSGGSHGILVAHLPDAYKDTVTTRIVTGDTITIDLENGSVNSKFDGASTEERNKIVKKQLTFDNSERYLGMYSKCVRNITTGFSI